MRGVLEVRTLTDGGQTPVAVAEQIAAFVGGARSTLDFAHYDFNLDGDTAGIVGGAIRAAAARGVAVRFVYNLDHRNPIPVPPPPEPDGLLIASLEVPVRAIAGVPDLMHHKYVVRDNESVWTGSTNWTKDSWSRQENVIVDRRVERLAVALHRELRRALGHGRGRTQRLRRPPARARREPQVRAWFTPGNGEGLSHRIGKAIGRARRRVRIASPVITGSHPLDARGEDLRRRARHRRLRRPAPGSGRHLPVAPERQHRVEAPAARAGDGGAFSGKRSTPWGEGTLHDFMHAKVTVADDTVFTGSFNLSRSGEMNAENVLEFEDPELADRLAGYIDEVRARYPAFALMKSTAPSGPPPLAASGDG